MQVQEEGIDFNLLAAKFKSYVCLNTTFHEKSLSIVKALGLKS